MIKNNVDVHTVRESARVASLRSSLSVNSP